MLSKLHGGHDARRPRQSVAADVTTALVASLLAAATAVVAAPVAHADVDAEHGTVNPRPSDSTVSFVDGVTYTIAQVGTKVVVGGTFTQVGPGQRGAAGVVNVAGSTFGSAFPDVVGAVYAAAPDGSGGWYLGGDFPTVGGQARSDLAHVDSTGTLTAWAPSADGAVRAIAVGSDGIYVGGDFANINGVPAGGLAKLDATTGAVLWNGSATGGGVRSVLLSSDGSTLYAAGLFTALGGQTRTRIGAVSAATGVVNATFLPGAANQNVYTLGLQGSSLWLAGDFTKVNGVTRNRLAKVDGTTGALDPLTVSINGKVNTILTDSTSGNVYLGGAFSTVGGLARAHLAAVNMTSGAVSTLTFPTIKGDIYGMALDGTSGLDVTGNFSLLPERTAPTVLARIDLGTATITSVVPYQQTPKSLARTTKSGTSGGTVLLRAGGSLLVAGDFSDYGLVTRNHIAAYDLTTGALDLGFDPAPDGDYVHSIKGSADGTSIFVGGSFANIGGVARRNLAKLSLAGGVVDPTFNPSPDAYVKDMAVKADGTALYVGGDFDNIAGQPMTKLAGLDPVTGAMLADFNFP